MLRTYCKNLLALFLLAAMLLAGLVLPRALATSENPSEQVQEVVAMLEQLQRVHIDPSWPPDIEANLASVQALLDAYLQCTTAERNEFTPQQQQDLRAYFEALYSIQGRNPSEVNSLFSGRSAASSSSSSASSSSSSQPAASSSSSQAPSSSSQPASSATVSSSAESSSVETSSVETSSVASAPSESLDAAASVSYPTPPSVARTTTASSSSSSSYSERIDRPSFPPQIPSGGGLYGFMGSKSLASALLVLLSVLAVVVFIRFLAALRAAGRSPNIIYGDHEVDPENPVYPEEKLLSDSEKRRMAAEEKRAVKKEQKELRAQERAERKRKRKEAKAGMAIEEENPDTKDTGELTFPVPETKPGSSTEPVEPRDKEVALSSGPVEPLGREVLISEPVEPFPSTPDNPLPERKLPDIPPSHGPRTGKPPKMPFQPGGGDDLDFMDE